MFELGYVPLFLLLLFWFRVLWLTLIKDFSSRGAEIRFHLAFKTSGKKKRERWAVLMLGRETLVCV